ncbi:MAG: glycosyltransferase family 4 protein [Flavobacteriaceae bacterium]
MKILHITTRIDGSGGLQKTISVRLNFLARMGYEVHLITTNSENQPIYFTLDKSIKHIDIQNVSSFFRYRKLIKNLHKTINPDIVIVSDNGLKGFLVPYFLPKKTKTIFELHATKSLIVQESNRWLRFFGITEFLINVSIRKFDVFACLSLKETELWNTKNTVVIPNPVSFTSEKPSDLTRKKVIFAGRQTLIKGIDLLVEIWEKVHKKHPDWSLEIYGENSDEYPVQKVIDKKNLTASVSVFEPVSDISKKYSEASLLLLTSRFESFGLVLVEAMHCGLPCVAFDAPTGPSSILKNNHNGFLIPCFDTEMFSQKIIELIENEKLRKQMGANALKSTAKFDFDRVMDKWLMLYQKLK